MFMRAHNNKIVVLLFFSLALGGCWPGDSSNDNPIANNASGGGTTPVSGIGSGGGTVTGYYSAKLLIPPGALTTNTDIAITRDSSGAPDMPTSGVDTAGATYALTPHGTTFAQPATVSIPFDVDRIPTDATPVLYKAEPGGSFSAIPTTVDNNMLTADVSNFSWVIPGYASTRPRMVYALTDGATKVSSFKITKGSGALSASTSSAPVGANPISVSVHPSRRFAYVTNAGSSTTNNIAPNSISVYHLDPVTGNISGPTDTKQANGNPISAVIHPTGKFVYVVNEVRFGSPIGNISVFTVNPTTGTLTAAGTTADSGGAPATALAISPSGDYAYVTYMWTTGTPSGNTYWSTVKTYAVNQSTGLFTGPIGSAATGDNPWSIVVTPDGHYAYVGNATTNNGVLDIYSINQSTGVLSLLSSSLTLPTAKPASLAMDSQGRFLYVGQQYPTNYHNLVVYSINPANGSLTNMWGGLTGSGSLVGPIAVVAEPQGEFVYAMDVTGEIVPYHLNAATGELTPSGSAVTGLYLGGGTIGIGDPFFFAASGTSPVWQNGYTTGGAIYASSGGSGGGGGGGNTSPPPASAYELDVTYGVWGGNIVSSPAGIDYSSEPILNRNKFSAEFATGSVVTLCETPASTPSQAYDVNWTGTGGCGGTATCTHVTMNHDQSCHLDLTPVSTR